MTRDGIPLNLVSQPGRQILLDRACPRCDQFNNLTRDPEDPVVIRFAGKPFDFDMWECQACRSWVNMNAGQGA